MTNAVSWHTIKNSLYSYGALSVGNQLVVKLPSNPETRKKVRDFVNKCYLKIVNVGVFLLPLVPAAIGAINNYILSDTGDRGRLCRYIEGSMENWRIAMRISACCPLINFRVEELHLMILLFKTVWFL